MFVDSEVLTGPSGMAVYKDTIQKWDPPNDKIRSPIQIATEFSTTFGCLSLARLRDRRDMT